MKRMLIALFILLIPGLSVAKNLYVATNGSDSNTYANNDINH